MLNIGVFKKHGDRQYGKDTLHVLAENGPMIQDRIAQLIKGRYWQQTNKSSILASISRKTGHIQKLEERGYVRRVLRDSIYDLDMIVPTFKGIITAIYADVSENKLGPQYLFLDYSGAIKPLMKHWSRVNNSRDYINWLTYSLNQTNVFNQMCISMEEELEGIDLDNVSENIFVEIYYRSLADERDHVLDKLVEDNVLSKNMEDSERVRKTLDWMGKYKYLDNQCCVYYWVKNFELIGNNVNGYLHLIHTFSVN